MDNTHAVVVASNLNNNIAINFLGFGSDIQNWQNGQSNHDFQYLIKRGYALGYCQNCNPAVPPNTPLSIVSAYDAIAVVPSANGYRIADFKGSRYAYGNPTPDLYSGSFPSSRIAVDLKNSSYSNGYWMLSQNGEIYSFTADYLGGANQYTGSCAASRMAVTPSGRGYLILCGDGAVFNFGDSTYQQGHGLPPGCGGLNCAPGGPHYAVDVAITPSNSGYYILTTDGAIFTFGDAVYRATYGSCGGLNCLSGGWDPARALMRTGDGGGYWIMRDDGAVYAFGNARYHGGVNTYILSGFIQWFAASGASYWPVSGYVIMGADNAFGDGGNWCFGDAPNGCYGDAP